MEAEKRKNVVIKPVTHKFIKEFNRLNDEGKIPSKGEVMKELGIKSASTLSNILSASQNIQHEQWVKFEQKYLPKKGKGADEMQSDTPVKDYEKEYHDLLKKYTEKVDEYNDYLKKSSENSPLNSTELEKLIKLNSQLIAELFSALKLPYPTGVGADISLNERKQEKD